MRLRDILFPIGALVVGIGAGVAIGWFSKPEDDSVSNDQNDSSSLINDFIERVDPERLGRNLKRISGKNCRVITIIRNLVKPHYATSVGDYELSQMVKEQWASTLDDAWMIEYEIMHQWPVEENSFARLTIGKLSLSFLYHVN